MSARDRTRIRLLLVALAMAGGWISQAASIQWRVPDAVGCFDPAEFVAELKSPPFPNPFTDAELTGVFTAPNDPGIKVEGFADAQDGTLFRLRFAPARSNVTYRYELRFRASHVDERREGVLNCRPSGKPGPVIVSPQRPKHFVYAGSGRPFYPLGFTAYHLLDLSNSDAQLDTTLDYCVRHGFNKIRFLLTGYPRDFDRRTSADVEFGVVEDGKKAPNYGAPPGQVNPLPAWQGAPHAYDFTRFNVSYWQRVDEAVRKMRDRGIVATAIVTIEKQNLPDEYGRLTPREYGLYRYAIARLAAFDNVWWDLGNEHNEFRDTAWGETMGRFVKDHDPYDRLASAHAYDRFLYPTSTWADFIITQQYGDTASVHAWALQHQKIPKPYVNEEYGYEFNSETPGHGMNSDWTRRCHWAIAMAGGYATYGDWSQGKAWYYMGEPGPGPTPPQLKHLRAFFEALPFTELAPSDTLVKPGFCLATEPRLFVVYLPDGGSCDLDLRNVQGALELAWHDPRTGQSRSGGIVQGGAWRRLDPSPWKEDVAAVLAANTR